MDRIVNEIIGPYDSNDEAHADLTKMYKKYWKTIDLFGNHRETFELLEPVSPESFEKCDSDDSDISENSDDLNNSDK